MATIKNVNINGTVSKLSAGVYDVSEQNNGKHYSGISNVLSQANTDIPTNDRFPGMQIKFIQTISAKYTVVKTDSVVEQPIGTEIQSDPGVDSGTYEESQLNVAFSSLPDILNSSITYYLTVTETVDEQELTTYTTWKITLVQSSDNNYVQYRLMSTAWSTNVSDWQGVDDKPTAGSENFVQSGGVKATIDETLPEMIAEGYNNIVKTPISATGDYDQKVLQTDGTLVDYTRGYWYVREYSVDGNMLYIISGYVGSPKKYCLYVFVDSNGLPLSYGVIGNEDSPRTYETVVKSPAGAVKVYVQGNSAYSKGIARLYKTESKDFHSTYFTSINFYDKTSGSGNWTYLYKNGSAVAGTALVSFTLSASNRSLVYNKNQTPKVRVIEDYFSDHLDDDVLLLQVSSKLYPLDGKLLAIALNSVCTNELASLSNTIDENKVKFDESILDIIPASEKKSLMVVETTNQNLDTNGAIVSGSQNRRLYKFSVAGGKKYHIIGHVAATDIVLYAFYSGENVVAIGPAGSGESQVYNVLADSPVNADTLYVAGNVNVQAGKCYEISQDVTIFPKLAYEAVSRSTGVFSETNYGKGLVATPRFIKNCENFLVSANRICQIFVAYYDKNFGYIGASDWTNMTANVATSFTPASGCAYMKICIRIGTSYPDISMVELSLTGHFEKDWDTFNVRPSDDGYQRVIVHPNVTDPTCCDTITDNVQDSEQLLTDYGVICLPTQYKNTGKPTRLIIYCHGAAVNYAATVSRFDSQDLEPDYWLAEGYAILDVEGNPFNNTDEHFYIPQAMECYVAAYKWAIEHYNLCRDGIFLGGRSMGGGMTFNLLRRECSIPVIAGCPNVPASTPQMCWNYMTGARRKFCADKLGFANQPTWTSTSRMPDAEWQCLKDNFDKLVKYSPAWAIITDLPAKDVLLSDAMNISKSTSSSSAEDALYGSLHASVKVPVKIFGCLDDTTCYVDRTSMLYYKMLLNSGQIVELRLFNSGGHHYDTQNENLRTTITTRYGEEMTNVPVVYIEMLQFWRRYEQDN